MATPARAFRTDNENIGDLALQAIPAAVMVLDEAGGVRYASPQAADILGGEVDSVAEGSKGSGSSPREEVFALLREACRNGAAVSRLVSLDLDSRRHFQIAAGPVPGAGEEKLTAVVILEVTEAISQSGITRDFVRQVRHDLRGPLTSMRGAVDLLLTGRLGPLQEKQKKILALVEKATHQMTVIVSGNQAKPGAEAGGRGEEGKG